MITKRTPRDYAEALPSRLVRLPDRRAAQYVFGRPFHSEPQRAIDLSLHHPEIDLGGTVVADELYVQLDGPSLRACRRLTAVPGMLLAQRRLAWRGHQRRSSTNRSSVASSWRAMLSASIVGARSASQPASTGRPVSGSCGTPWA